LGRGDYLAFDEGWYLLLGRSLFTGEGYSLVGFPHTALSPLFPLLAGALGGLIDSWVWGGRIVAAVASGLVVLPAWAVFRRMARDRTAFIAAALVAVLPSMAPFVVPYWIGADLWVGAEPLLHLFLYSGVALWLVADGGEMSHRLRPTEGHGSAGSASAQGESPGAIISGDDGPRPAIRTLSWLGAGAAFGLAFLARPEAIITWGLLGLVALGLAAAARSPRRLYGAALMGVGFVLLASPYWLYIHDVSGEWSLTGRGVALPTVVAGPEGTPARPGAARVIERMLWEDDEAYRDRLYGLDATGLRLRSSYWGVQPPVEASGTTDAGAEAGLVGPTRAAAAAASERSAGTDAAGSAAGETGTAPAGSLLSGTRVDPARTDAGRQTAASRSPPRGTGPPPAALYVTALRQILPLLLWLFAILGAIRPRPREVLRRELPVAGALIGTGLAIAAVVAVDSRTQLFLVPLLAFYAARGVGLVEEVVRERVPDLPLRPGFVELVLAATAVVWLLGIDARRLYLSVSLGSPHHIVAEQNRAVAEKLDGLLGTESGPVASWHPAIAVYADRDWRVLPFAGLPEIVRYLNAAGADAMVLSAYYPPDFGVEDLNTRYLVLPVPDAEGPPRPWELRLLQGDTIRALGRLEPADGADGATGGKDATRGEPAG
ncbi:MAG: hypothetical protein ACN0LA_09590, partial [Candidatus Longimicrobiales bacterium M2_2A_002]